MRSGSQGSILVTQTVYCFYSCTMHLRAHNVSKSVRVWCMLLKWDSPLLLCKWQWLCATKKKREVIRWINYVYVVICMEEFNSLASKGQITNTQNTQANKAGTTAGKLLLSETTDIFHVSQHRWCFSHFRKCLKYHLQYGHGPTTSKKRKTINFMVMTMNQKRPYGFLWHVRSHHSRDSCSRQ